MGAFCAVARAAKREATPQTNPCHNESSGEIRAHGAAVSTHLQPCQTPSRTVPIRDYVRRSADELRRIEAIIAPHIGDPIQVWGTGQLLFKLLHDTCLGNARITAFLDSNPKLQGSTLRGVPVRAPASAEPGVPILIASTLHGPVIAAAARSMGLRNPLILLGATPPR